MRVQDLFKPRGKHKHLPSVIDYVDADGDCWLWTGYALPSGYGLTVLNGSRPYVHRLFYETLVGPIEEDLVIDHLCRVRNCVNPAHMEPVTRGENTLRGYSLSGINSRKLYCKRGHSLFWHRKRLSTGDSECGKCRKLRVWDN